MPPPSPPVLYGLPLWRTKTRPSAPVWPDGSLAPPGLEMRNVKLVLKLVALTRFRSNALPDWGVEMARVRRRTLVSPLAPVARRRALPLRVRAGGDAKLA